MHNGCVSDFIRVKRHLRRLLDDDIYNWIKGDTDSEHLFALCLQIAKGRDLSRVESFADVLEEAFQEILLLSKTFNADGISYFNVCITDGRRLVASRYCSDPSMKSLTMHYAMGSGLISPTKGEDEQPIMAENGHKKCILVSSEKLSNASEEWHMLPPQHLLLVDEDMNVSIRKLRLG